MSTTSKILVCVVLIIWYGACIYAGIKDSKNNKPYYKCMLENDPKYNPVLPLKGLPQRSLVYLKFVFEDYQEGDSEDDKWCYRRAFPQMGGNSDSVDFVVDTGETLRFSNEDYEKTWFAYNRNPEGQYEQDKREVN